jgi:hypothetical protein
LFLEVSAWKLAVSNACPIVDIAQAVVDGHALLPKHA